MAVVEQDKKFLTIKEAAKRLGVVDETVRLWIKAGYMKARKIQPRRRYGDRCHPHYRVAAEELDRIQGVFASGLPITAA